MSDTAAQPPLEPSTPWQSYVWQICSALEIDVAAASNHTWELTLPEELAERWNAATLVGRFRDGQSAAPDASGEDSLEPDGQLFQRALTALEEERRVLHLSPVEQAVRVTSISDKVLAAYTVDGGQKRLAGCTIEDRPVLRMTYWNEGQLDHFHYLADGARVDEELETGLHLDQVLPHERQREWGTIDEFVYRWIENARQEIGREGFLSAGLVWCKYAIGKVELSVGTAAVQVPFEGWSTLIADGVLTAPPYVCPETGVRSYHLAADDEGYLTAREALARCEDTGRCLLATRMTTCPDTKITALDQFFEPCAATGERVHHSAISTCSVCRQNVRINQLYHQTCPTCRSLKPIRKVDPVMARLLGEYPQLDRWKKWKLAESQSCYVLMGTKWVQRILLVIRRDDLQIQRAAKGSRFSRSWDDVDFSELA